MRWASMLLGISCFLAACTREELLCKDRPIDSWVESLRTGTKERRIEAASALDECGHRLRDEGQDWSVVAQALLDALKDPDAEVRRRIAVHLRSVGISSPEMIPPLLQHAKDPDPHIRASAIGALVWLWSKAEPALPAIIEALSDPDQEVRKAAASVLENIGPRLGVKAMPAIPALKKLAESGDEAAAVARHAIELIETAAAE